MSPVVLSLMVNPKTSAGEPAPEIPPVKARRSELNWRRIFLASGVGAALIIGALWVASTFFTGSNLGRVFGVPQDFPIYPGAGLVGVRENFGTNGSSVVASWEVDAPVDKVTAFYEERLNQAPWTINRINTTDGSIEFQRTGSKSQGIIQIFGHGQPTRVDMQLLK